MMLPSEYKQRYKNISISLDDGSTVPINVDRYRLNGMNYNADANRAFMDKLKAKGIDTTLNVDTALGPQKMDPKDFGHAAFKGAEPASFIVGDDKYGMPVTLDARNISAWSVMAHYCFLGKGAPEHCQIVLQLAAHWGLATDLQTYADNALGLDCNGFVGNYLWHVKKNRSWRDLGLRNHDLGPDALISGYFDNQTLLARWDALDPAQSYIMGMVNGDGDIIPGGPGSGAGHIVITDPHTRADRPQKNGTTSFAVWVVESTAAPPPGLHEGWYSLHGMVSAGVFSVNREQWGSTLPVKIAQVR